MYSGSWISAFLRNLLLTSSEEEDSHFALTVRVYSENAWSDIAKEYSHDPFSRENIRSCDMRASKLDLPSSGGVGIEREEKYILLC